MSVAIDYDTKLFLRKQPGGMYAVHDAAEVTGRIFWVGSNVTGASNSAGYGQNPGKPFATAVYAETKCLSQRGDLIYVMANHTETLLSAAGAVLLLLDVANLRIVGIGRSTRPAFLLDGHANNYINITGADTTLENMTFKAGHADVAKGFSVAAAGVAFLGCHFIENVATENFLFSIQTTAAADELLLDDCTFISIDASADAGIQIVGACNGVQIYRSYFHGPYVTSCIEAITNACLNIRIEDNMLLNPLAGDDLAGAVDLVANSTGMIKSNGIYHADNTDCLTAIDGGNCGKIGNFTANEFAEEGGVAATQSA